MKLVHKETKQEVKVGDRVKTFRDEEGVLAQLYPPGTPGGGMNGKVRITLDGEKDDPFGAPFYCSVINCEFVE